MSNLSKIMMVRVTPEMKSAIEDSASHLRLRAADIVRYLLADGLKQLETKITKMSPNKNEIEAEEYYDRN